MELIFNELSLHHRAGSQFEAKDLMKTLLLTCKNANRLDFNRLRVNEDFTQLVLFENYTITDWLSDNSVRIDYKTLLLSFKRCPFISEDDENIENLFIHNYYHLNTPEVQELHMQVTEGLAVAFLHNTLSISFATNEVWKKTIIELLERTEDKEESVNVKHISNPEHIVFHREWIESKRPVNLIETDIQTEKKEINIGNHHGNNILNKIARKLINSCYVVKIINSLRFNPNAKHFIRQIHPDGKIEIVLTWTAEGYGLIFQTTGRNLQETKAIADIIEKDIKK